MEKVTISKEQIAELKETINFAKDGIKTMQRQLNSYKNSLLSCNYVMQYGAYTIGSTWDEERNARVYDYTLDILPSLWSMVAVDHFKETVIDSENESKFKFSSYSQYYKEAIKTKKSVINSLEEIIAKN